MMPIQPFGLIVLLAASSVGAAEPLPSAAAEFEGKIVLVFYDKSTTLENKSDSLTLESPTVVQLGGRAFIYGVAYSPDWLDEGDRPPERKTGLACDRVLEFQVFSLEEFDKYAKNRWNSSDD